jgi:hypothetical protein
MEFIGLLIYTTFIAIMWFLVGLRLGKSINIKDDPSEPRPIIAPAPQSTKQSRTPDEQELHEYMEDNPR